MTHDELIEIAKQAGIAVWHKDLKRWTIPYGLKPFAKLVAYRERKQCVDAIEEIDDGESPEYRECQEAIRARGEK